MRKGRRQKLNSGDEWDVVSKYARKIVVMKSATIKRVKQQLNRRARRECVE